MPLTKFLIRKECMLCCVVLCCVVLCCVVLCCVVLCCVVLCSCCVVLCLVFNGSTGVAYIFMKNE